MTMDPYGRKLNRLRLSVTDRCNLRCLYCMPKGGIPWLPHGGVLTCEEPSVPSPLDMSRVGG